MRRAAISSSMTMVCLFLSFLSFALNAAQIQWISPTDGNWHEAENWGGSQVPGIGDEIQIGQGVTVTVDSVPVQVGSLELSGNLVIAQVEFIVNSIANVTGNLLLDVGASYIADGPSAHSSLTGTVVINNAIVEARNGGLLDLPQTTRLIGDVAIRAIGTGSVLDMSATESIGIGLPGPLTIPETYGREYSVYHQGYEGENSLAISSSFSRELSVFHRAYGSDQSLSDLKNIVSREFSIFLPGESVTAEAYRQSAVARSLSIEHLDLANQTSQLPD